jgi:hypothetical protein
LQAHGRADDAWRALQKAHTLLLDAVRHLHDEGLRRNFLNKVASNRAVLLAWLREAAQRRCRQRGGSPICACAAIWASPSSAWSIPARD